MLYFNQVVEKMFCQSCLVIIHFFFSINQKKHCLKIFCPPCPQPLSHAIKSDAFRFLFGVVKTNDVRYSLIDQNDSIKIWAPNKISLMIIFFPHFKISKRRTPFLQEKFSGKFKWKIGKILMQTWGHDPFKIWCLNPIRYFRDESTNSKKPKKNPQKMTNFNFKNEFTFFKTLRNKSTNQSNLIVPIQCLMAILRVCVLFICGASRPIEFSSILVRRHFLFGLVSVSHARSLRCCVCCAPFLLWWVKDKTKQNKTNQKN